MGARKMAHYNFMFGNDSAAMADALRNLTKATVERMSRLNRLAACEARHRLLPHEYSPALEYLVDRINLDDRIAVQHPFGDIEGVKLAFSRCRRGGSGRLVAMLRGNDSNIAFWTILGSSETEIRNSLERLRGEGRCDLSQSGAEAAIKYFGGL